MRVLSGGFLKVIKSGVCAGGAIGFLGISALGQSSYAETQPPSKSLIDAMNGTINVVSEVGSGSTFNLSLPLPIGLDEKNNTPQLLETQDGFPALIFSNDDLLQPVLKAYLDPLNMFPMIANKWDSIEKILLNIAKRDVLFPIIIIDMSLPNELSTT
uniref:hypothetical protein n=1 Tax=uncultured Kiloniella sp. TaxID=1133091 RepID=UPI0026075D20